MNKTISKKLFALALACMLALTLLPGAARAEPAASGSCGPNVTYRYDGGVTGGGSGTLTISGTGAMYNYSGSNAPWEAYKTEITSVVCTGVKHRCRKRGRESRGLSRGVWRFPKGNTTRP